MKSLTTNGCVEIHRGKGKRSKEFYTREKRNGKKLGNAAQFYKRRDGIHKNLIAKMKVYNGTKVLVNDCTRSFNMYWLYADGTKEQVFSPIAK